MEVWGPRINHISQFGLFTLGLAGFFYVVLPIYQKAVLEEALAKLQVELKTATEAVTAKEAELRNATARLAAIERDMLAATKSLDERYSEVRAYAVASLLRSATAECSGLLIPPEPPAALKEQRRSRPPLAHAYRLIAVAPGPCLRDQFKASRSQKQLRPEDLKVLTEAAERVARDVDDKQRTVRKALDGLEAAARRDPEVLKPLEDGVLLRLLFAMYPAGKDRDEEIFKHRVDRTGSDLALAYGNEVREAIFALKTINWPNAKRKQPI